MAHIVGMLVAELDYVVEHIVVEADCTVLEFSCAEFFLSHVGYDCHVCHIAGYSLEVLAFAEVIEKHHVVGFDFLFGARHNLVVLADCRFRGSEDKESVVEFGGVRFGLGRFGHTRAGPDYVFEFYEHIARSSLFDFLFLR